MTLEHIVDYLRSLGYRVTLAGFIDVGFIARMLLISHPHTYDDVVLTVTVDGRLLNPDEVPAVAKHVHNFGLGVTRSGYLFPLNDIEGSVTEFLNRGILQKLDAALVFQAERAYLLPADMVSALPPNVSVRQVIAFEESPDAKFVMVYGPQVYRPLGFKRKAKNLFTKVNGNRPERVLSNLWKELLTNG